MRVAMRVASAASELFKMPTKNLCDKLRLLSRDNWGLLRELTVTIPQQ